MWNRKDALLAVKKHFRRDESCLLMLRLHRLFGMSRPEVMFLLSALAASVISAVTIPNKTPLYWLLLIMLFLVCTRLIVRRVAVENHLVLTEYALHRCICTNEPKVFSINWADIASVTVKRSSTAHSLMIVEIVCKKSRLSNKIVFPQKLFVMRFGKLKFARSKIDLSQNKPHRQRFAFAFSAEFMQILREIQSMPGYAFEIRTKGI